MENVDVSQSVRTYSIHLKEVLMEHMAGKHSQIEEERWYQRLDGGASYCLNCKKGYFLELPDDTKDYGVCKTMILGSNTFAIYVTPNSIPNISVQ